MIASRDKMERIHQSIQFARAYAPKTALLEIDKTVRVNGGMGAWNAINTTSEADWELIKTPWSPHQT